MTQLDQNDQESTVSLREELLELTELVRQYLIFYKDIGVTHVSAYQRESNSSLLLEETISSPQTRISNEIEEVKSYVDISVEVVEDETMPKKKSEKAAESKEQGMLFEVEHQEKPFSVVTKVDESLDNIRAELGHCCDLCNNCTHIVFGEGNSKAELMFIGEAPGAEEDAKGRPFVGAAGKLLDKIIEAMGLKREQVYITNVVKCRPPDNRKPDLKEIEACEPFLFREIAYVKPKIIVTLGATPMFSLLRIKDGITKMRGKFYNFQGIPVMATFHPAFLLRVPQNKREVWEDMKQVMAKLEEIDSQNQN